MSASSGPMTRRRSWRSRSIRASPRRRKISNSVGRSCANSEPSCPSLSLNLPLKGGGRSPKATRWGSFSPQARCDGKIGPSPGALRAPVLSLQGEAKRAANPAITTHELLAPFGGEQYCLWGAPVPPFRRLLAHLRPDADSQPDARLLLHAGGLYRRHHSRPGAEFLGRRALERRGDGGYRRADRAVPAAPSRRPGIAAGPAHARTVLHRRRPVPDGVDRGPDPAADAAASAGGGRGLRRLLSDL